MVIVVVGVSGSGKTTVGLGLAARLGWDFADGDEFHDEESKRRMRSGAPLTEEQRLPWLRRIVDWIDEHLAVGYPGVVTCSALRRGHRDLLGRQDAEVRLVYLDADRELIDGRLTDREGHFFPPSLIDSQFRALEPPTPDENILRVPAVDPPEVTVEGIISGLGLAPSAR